MDEWQAGTESDFFESGMDHGEKNLKIMDIAAGSLIVKEAGGSVTDFEGKENYLNSGRIVASNFSIHDEMLRNINTKFWYLVFLETY